MQYQPRFTLKQMLYIFSGTLFGALVLTAGLVHINVSAVRDSAAPH
jgi:hypothetical protein